MEVIEKEPKEAAVLNATQGRKRKLITERLRKSMKANDRNDWFNLIALLILLVTIISGVVYYFTL